MSWAGDFYDYALRCAACHSPDSGPKVVTVAQKPGGLEADAYIELRCTRCGEHWTAERVRVRFDGCR